MGKLTVIPTPIGNLEDMTLRGIRLLQEADVIACEDTRTSGILLKHYDIHTPRVSYHKHNERSRGEELLRRMKEGETVALISDAGMPGISDPGGALLLRCQEEGIPYEVLPGPSAAVTAVVGSALGDGKYFFYGFLPVKEGARERELDSLKEVPAPLVFYEAPHRLQKTLESLYGAFGDRRAVLARELTKVHEEYVAGSLKEFARGDIEFYLGGEFVIVVDGRLPQREEVDIPKELQKKLEQGMKSSQAVKAVAKEFGVGKNEVYEVSLRMKGDGV